MPDRGEREREQGRGGHREHGPRRGEQPHHHEHDHEPERVQRRPDHRPADLPQRHVARPERRREHRVVRLLVVELEEHVERGLGDRAVHRCRGEQRRRHEQRVRDRHAVRTRDVADQPADAQPDREQVEQRLEEPAEDDDPAGLVDVQVALDEQRRPPAAEPDRQHAQGRDVAAHEASFRRNMRNMTMTPDHGEPGEDHEVRERDERLLGQRPEARAARQRDAVPQREQPGDPADRLGQLLDREERAREQEQRRDPEAPDRVERRWCRAGSSCRRRSAPRTRGR